jgi:restriction endonuclease Mrr
LLDRIRQRGGIEAWSYNDVFDFAKEHYASNRIICVPATHFTAIEIALSDLRIDEIIAKIADNPEGLYNLQPRLFEEVVARLFQSQGMDVVLSAPGGDGGVDIYLSSQTAVGSPVFAVQCKRYSPKSKIGVSHIRALLGAVYINQLNKGILVTTSTFSSGALELLKERGYMLSGIDRDRLMEMIQEFLREKGPLDGSSGESS